MIIVAHVVVSSKSPALHLKAFLVGDEVMHLYQEKNLLAVISFGRLFNQSPYPDPTVFCRATMKDPTSGESFGQLEVNNTITSSDGKPLGVVVPDQTRTGWWHVLTNEGKPLVVALPTPKYRDDHHILMPAGACAAILMLLGQL